jgi:hypothetical protein
MATSKLESLEHKIKRGTIRNDGMVFCGYVKKCKNGQWWVTKEDFDRINENRRIYVRTQRAKNPDRFRAYERKIRTKNKDRYNQQRKTRRQKNLLKIREQENNAYYRNREKKIQAQNRYQKQKAENDFLFRESKKIKNLISKSFRDNGYSKNARAHDILGCSYDSFVKHIESLFLSGMNWNNRSEWHLDHIIPISSAKSFEDLVDLNHYKNFQPLWAKDNIRKGNKILK